MNTAAVKVALTRSPRLYQLTRRPYATGRYMLRRPHERDYAAFRLLHGDGMFLDVGANAGQSALSFRLHKPNPVMSVEPNPFHENDLRWTGRLVRRFRYRLWAAGASDTQAVLYVPVYRSVPLTTEASLDPAEITSSPSLRARLGDRMRDLEIVECDVPVRRLDSLKLAPSFVKLDVQGAELDALRGMSETLERHRPALMIEAAGEEIHDHLYVYGYRPWRYDHVRHALVETAPGDTDNTFFTREGSWA